MQVADPASAANAPAVQAVQAAAPPASDAQTQLREMTRAQLQSLAKQHGIKANQSNVVIISSLAAMFESSGALPAGPAPSEAPAPEATADPTPKRKSVVGHKSAAKRSIEAVAPCESAAEEEKEAQPSRRAPMSASPAPHRLTQPPVTGTRRYTLVPIGGEQLAA